MKIADMIKGQSEFWPEPYPGTTQAGRGEEVVQGYRREWISIFQGCSI